MFRDIGILCDESSSKEEIKRAFEDISRRLGSKSETAVAFRVLVHRMSMNTVSSTTIVSLIECLFEPDSDCEELTKEAPVLCDLLIQLIKGFPGLLKGNESGAIAMAHNLLEILVRDGEMRAEKVEILCGFACTLVQSCVQSDEAVESDGNRMKALSKFLEKLFMSTSIPQLAKSCMLTW